MHSILNFCPQPWRDVAYPGMQRDEQPLCERAPAHNGDGSARHCGRTAHSCSTINQRWRARPKQARHSLHGRPQKPRRDCRNHQLAENGNAPARVGESPAAHLMPGRQQPRSPWPATRSDREHHRHGPATAHIQRLFAIEIIASITRAYLRRLSLGPIAPGARRDRQTHRTYCSYRRGRPYTRRQSSLTSDSVRDS